MHRLLVLLFITLTCYSLSVGAVVYQNSTNPPPSCNSYTGSTPATASFLTFNTVVQRADRNGNFQNITAIITTSFTNFSGPTLNRLNTTATWVTNPLVTLTIDCPADGSACPFGSNSSSSVDVTDVTLTVFVSPGTNITLSSIQFSFDFPVTGATASYSYNQIVDPPPALDTFPTCQYINSVFTDLPAFNYELGYGYGEGRRITGDAELACGATCSNSASASITPSITPTPSISISNTPSISLTSTPSTSVTSTPSISLTSTPSTSITSTPSTSLTSTPSTSITSTPSNIPSVSNSPSSSPTSGASLSSTPSTTPSSSVSVSTSASASFVPSVSSTSSVSNSPSASGTSGASLSTTPSVSVSTTPSASFVPSASSTPSSSPSVSASSSGSVVPSQSPLGPLPSLTSSASQSSYPSYSPYPSPEPPTCVPTEVCCCDARRAEQALLISDLDDLQATAQRIDSRINSLDDVQSQVEALSAVNSQLKRIQSLLDSIQNP